MKLQNKSARFITILLFTGLMLSDSSCKKFVSGFEDDPNNPTSVNLSTLLSTSEVGLFIVYTGNANRFESMWMQHMGGTDRQYVGYGQYQIGPADNEYDWDNAYSGALEDLSLMLAEADQQTSPYYKGIGEIVEAMTVGIVTDMWGDVPFTDALKGQSESNFHPKYDTQQDVYNSIQSLLDDAIVNLQAASSTYVPASDDLIHQGDLNAWLITAHELKARFYNHLSKKTGLYDPAKVIAEAGLAEGLGAATDNDCNAAFGTNPNNANTWYQYFYTAGRSDMRCGRLLDSMVADNDPRQTAYANKNDAGGYVGTPDIDGTIITSASFPGDLYFANPAKSIGMVSYAELEFVKSEAAFNSGDLNTAADAYNLAIDASLSNNDLDASAIADYEATHNRDAASITKHDIMYQKWVALYTQEEVWTDWRRTGIPDLQPVTGAGTPIPRRMLYPQSELSYNASNVPSGLDQFSSVWWDQ